VRTITLATDHPAWLARPEGLARLMACESSVWLAVWGPSGLSLSRLAGEDDAQPIVVETGSGTLPPRTPHTLAGKLAGLGTVVRVANPWLWDALSTAILRQVVRAAQAKALYGRWCAAHGRVLDTPHGSLPLVPDPGVVLSLPDEAFTAVGAAFHRTALRAAATAYLADGPAWAALAAAELVVALAAVPRIGPWTSRAAAADATGDFSVYPHGDLAVRTRARRAAPDQPWPEQERAFETAWRALADDPRQLHSLTTLTLSWGSHAHTCAEADIEPEHRR
jgi:DNA-3-methyladenine glycosylase II